MQHRDSNLRPLVEKPTRVLDLPEDIFPLELVPVGQVVLEDLHVFGNLAAGQKVSECLGLILQHEAPDAKFSLEGEQRSER